MAAEQGVVERLREQRDNPRAGTFEVVVDQDDLDALLAVVEAAQEIAEQTGEGARGEDVPLALLVALDDALARLHTQASDEGKP